jgi:hypothetical protein
MILPLKTIIEKRKELWQQSHDIEQDKKYRLALADYLIEHPEMSKTIQKHPESLVEMFFVIVDKE